MSDVLELQLALAREADAKEHCVSLLEAATKRAASLEALSESRLREIESLQAEISGLQVELVDHQVRSGEMLDRLSFLERELDARERILRELLDSPAGRLLRAVGKFAAALRRRGR